jgi:hypothetical protein
MGSRPPKISDARRRWVEKTKTANNHCTCETLGGVPIIARQISRRFSTTPLCFGFFLETLKWATKRVGLLP